MKTNIILLSLTLLLPATATLARPAPEPGKHIIETLQLDDGRAEEVRQIMAASHEQRQALHKEVRQKMKALHKAQQSKLEAVLTDEEMAALKEARQERRHQRKSKMHGKHRHHDRS